MASPIKMNPGMNKKKSVKRAVRKPMPMPKPGKKMLKGWPLGSRPRWRPSQQPPHDARRHGQTERRARPRLPIFLVWSIPMIVLLFILFSLLEYISTKKQHYEI
jgi:hypothetical protein